MIVVSFIYLKSIVVLAEVTVVIVGVELVVIVTVVVTAAVAVVMTDRERALHDCRNRSLLATPPKGRLNLHLQ